MKGSFDAAFTAVRIVKKYGITASVNTQITSLVIPQLRELMNLFIDAGAKNWQVQLTVAMGRAPRIIGLLLQPYELLEFMPLLADLYEEGAERGLLQPGNNIGYFGPYESLWRVVTIEFTGPVVMQVKTLWALKPMAQSKAARLYQPLLMLEARYAM